MLPLMSVPVSESFLMSLPVMLPSLICLPLIWPAATAPPAADRKTATHERTRAGDGRLIGPS